MTHEERQAKEREKLGAEKKQEPIPEANDTPDRGYQLAFLLQCIQDEEIKFDTELKKLKGDFQSRLGKLRIEAARLQHNILTGQKEMFEIPAEPTDGVVQAVADLAAPILDPKSGITSIEMSVEGGPTVRIGKTEAENIHRAAGRKQ